MGREVRRVPKDWEHPQDGNMHHIPLFDGSFKKDAAEWDEADSQWENGFVRDYTTDGWKSKEPRHTGSYAEYSRKRPDEADYMPDWPEEQRTHYQMYETVTKGTPISPVMESPEALARWLADNGASAGPYMTATYEQWLAMIKR